MYNCGLILEGGGMRGVYTAGIIDYFLEKGLEFSSVYGVSAGSINGLNFAAKQKNRGVRDFIWFRDDDRYCGLNYWLKTGDYFNNEFVYGEVPNSVDPVDYDADNNNPMKFYAVVSNTKTGRREYIPITDAKNQVDYIRASCSLPILTKPVEIGDKTYMDGGICDSIPLEKSEFDGNEKNVVILTQHREFVKKPTENMPVIRKMYGEYPNFIHALETRHEMYNRQRRHVFRQEEQGKAFVILPSHPVDIDRMEHDAGKLWMWYAEGKKDAAASYDKLIEYLNK